ncbi:uncharacterized protein LOC143198518 [Rhynchophorus ferrugineus]|uniref:uncharacterized protein LOC143198518 n=1 Tax=Rhynchophorus ferrugineus TaxID=354439 RepID=UPI003FCC7AA9
MPCEMRLPPESSNTPICRYDSPEERTSRPRLADTLTTTTPCTASTASSNKRRRVHPRRPYTISSPPLQPSRTFQSPVPVLSSADHHQPGTTRPTRDTKKRSEKNRQNQYF